MSISFQYYNMYYLWPKISQSIKYSVQILEQNVEDKIIDAARHLFYEKGYSGTKMRNIANKADVNLALLHYYFRTKDKIFEIVFNEAFSMLFSKLDKALSKGTDIFDKIRLMVKCYVDVAAKNPQLPLFIINEISINPKLVMSVVGKHKTANGSTTNLEIFFKEIEEASDQQKIKPVKPIVLFIDILSLSLFPFVAKDLLMSTLHTDKKAFNQILKGRAEHISCNIINSLK